MNVFKTALGDQYTWISPIPGTELSIPVRPAEGNEHIAKLEDQIRTINENAGLIPQHDHDDKISEELVFLLSVLVWFVLFLLLAIAVGMQCCEKTCCDGR